MSILINDKTRNACCGISNHELADTLLCICLLIGIFISRLVAAGPKWRER
ncbi:hypothetical protein KIS1582_3896 [Cytobacillus firmus]|uniref:Uncharacterized protein n=1 Tax=Cytobacillus firmus TaxID=1399 RepID=A0A800MU11_CYTFI|nr:hypothetical protein KIS1582_3896 [Cytobacillus firmus]